MPAEGRENPLLKKGNSNAFFKEKYLIKNIYYQLSGIHQKFIVKHIEISPKIKKNLNQRFCLIYTGQRRLCRALGVPRNSYDYVNSV